MRTEKDCCHTERERVRERERERERMSEGEGQRKGNWMRQGKERESGAYLPKPQISLVRVPGPRHPSQNEPEIY